MLCFVKGWSEVKSPFGVKRPLNVFPKITTIKSRYVFVVSMDYMMRMMIHLEAQTPTSELITE